MTLPTKHYRDAEPSPNFAAIEEEVQANWKAQGIFEESVSFRPKMKDGKSNEFVFYDGPPFANGLPHYGHIVTGFVKDLIPRYQTMRGKHVDRRFGWDCHGLPAELEVEKELGISGAKAIRELGIGKFNAQCATSVQRFTKEWEWYVNRQGRWVSFENQYRTMDLSFMESVMWAFKQLWDKGLIYESYRVVPYSWAVQTPLSHSETRMDNSYRDREDPALTIAFELNGDLNAELLAWTTTPWTLTSNLALAVKADLEYGLYEKGDQRWILATSAAERYARELEGFTCTRTMLGSELVGLTYKPLFPYFASRKDAFRVIAAEFVDATSGTGTVHIAPGFGEDDLEVATQQGIGVVVPVDEAGRFTDEVPDYAGQNVILEANGNVIKDLKVRGVVVRHEQIRHSYPHCWRTDTPLIYKAVNSWYIAVSKYRERMVELNKGIKWVPAHIGEGAFANWLANARDWNVSRNRFWGSPLPIWVSDNPAYPRMDCYGSVAELEKDFGVKVTDLHRPFIDTLTRPNPDDPTGKSTMRRVPDVLDCWFESGSMPYAQLHYPFENTERFEQNFPGDFIVEYAAQTRGWFYSLMALSTMIFDRAPFRSCVGHGIVLDENNQKLSKRLKNYPDPVDVFSTHGADALRWYMLSSPLMTGGDLVIPRTSVEIGKAMRIVLLRMWNAYTFFTLYANIDGIKATERTDSTHPLDQYILGKTHELVRDIQANLDDVNIPGAYNVAPEFVEALNNWYIRNRRAAFWAEGMNEDKQAAFDTLYTVLCTACRALAPLAPMVTERIYTGLTGEKSVHLANWPELAALPMHSAIVEGMELARHACSGVLSLREVHQRRTRLPLKSLTIAHPEAEKLKPYLALIAEAVNVREVKLAEETASFASNELKVNAKLGARLGSKFKDVLAAQRSGAWQLLPSGDVLIADVTLAPADFELRLKAKEGVTAEAFDQWRGIVVLDITIDPELEAEGWARDVIRFIQSARKESKLVITDRITVTLGVPARFHGALTKHADWIRRETLANDLKLQDAPVTEAVVNEDLDGEAVQVALSVAA